MKVRDLSELPDVIGQISSASRKLPDGSIVPLANNVRSEVEWQGHGYYIRSRNGKRLPLTARVKIATENGPNKAARIVGGSPIGAWHIVEGGSSAHLITGTKERLTRRGNVRRVTARARLAEFASGDSITGRPLHIPGIGFRQYAMHPGHGPIGAPWKKAMGRSGEIVADTLSEYATKALLKAWGK